MEENVLFSDRPVSLDRELCDLCESYEYDEDFKYYAVYQNGRRKIKDNVCQEGLAGIWISDGVYLAFDSHNGGIYQGRFSNKQTGEILYAGYLMICNNEDIFQEDYYNDQYSDGFWYYKFSFYDDDYFICDAPYLCDKEDQCLSASSDGVYMFSHFNDKSFDPFSFVNAQIFFGARTLKELHIDIKDLSDWQFDGFYTKKRLFEENFQFIEGLKVQNGVLVRQSNWLSGSIFIPEGIRAIGLCAFIECDLITSVVLPQGLTKISAGAFCDCTRLTSVEIPNSVTEIGPSAFYECTSLTRVVIPDGVTFIGRYAFFGCTSLTRVEIPPSVTQIGENAFDGCSNLDEATLARIKEILV